MKFKTYNTQEIISNGNQLQHTEKYAISHNYKPYHHSLFIFPKFFFFFGRIYLSIKLLDVKIPCSKNYFPPFSLNKL